MEIRDPGAAESTETAAPVQETTALIRKGLNVLVDDYSLTVNEVTFRPGERTKLHKHSLGQVLYVTGGSGIVANETDQRFVDDGDMVFFAPGEIHWHGSAEDTTGDFSHLSFVLHDDSGADTTTVVDEYTE